MNFLSKSGLPISFGASYLFLTFKCNAEQDSLIEICQNLVYKIENITNSFYLKNRNAFKMARTVKSHVRQCTSQNWTFILLGNKKVLMRHFIDAIWVEVDKLCVTSFSVCPLDAC